MTKPEIKRKWLDGRIRPTRPTLARERTGARRQTGPSRGGPAHEQRFAYKPMNLRLINSSRDNYSYVSLSLHTSPSKDLSLPFPSPCKHPDKSARTGCPAGSQSGRRRAHRRKRAGREASCASIDDQNTAGEVRQRPVACVGGVATRVHGGWRRRWAWAGDGPLRVREGISEPTAAAQGGRAAPGRRQQQSRRPGMADRGRRPAAVARGGVPAKQGT